MRMSVKRKQADLGEVKHTQRKEYFWLHKSLELMIDRVDKKWRREKEKEKKSRKKINSD